MNIANRITITRIAMIPIYMILMYINTVWSIIAAGILFILASVTDSLDGYVARKMNMITDFGKFLDPLADKLLVLASVVIFMGYGRIASWIVVIIVARELIVTSFRCVAASKNKILAADIYGKLKTIFQLIALSAMHFEDLIDRYIPVIHITLIIDIIFYISLVLTVYSGFHYIYKNRNVLF